MKSKNLELALSRFEISQANDTVSYENHYCNGFSGAESEEAYCNHLENLYNDYFLSLRNQTDALVLQNLETSLKFLQTKITRFTEIQNEFELKSNLDFWESTIKSYESDLIYKSNRNTDYSLLRKIKNQIDTMKFFAAMIKTHNYFIDKALTELTQLYNAYNPQPQKMTEREIEKSEWDNLLKEENDILQTSDLARIFYKDSRTINRWVKEGKINPIDKFAKPHQFRKDDVKKYYLKMKKKRIHSLPKMF